MQETRSHLWRNASFTRLVGAVSVDALGGRITHLLLITLIPLASPGRILAYSEGSLTIGLPPILLAAFVGVLVDRWDRRAVLSSSLLLQGAMLLLAPLLFGVTGSLAPAWVILFLFFAGDVFKNSSAPAMLPAMVAPRDITAANSIWFTFARALTVIGMVGGGFLVRWTGWRWSFVIDAATRVAAGLLVLGIRPSPAFRARAGQSTVSLGRSLAQGLKRFAGDVGAVIRLLGRNRYVAFVMFSIVVSSAITGIAYTVLLYMIQQVLNLGSSGVGIYLGILAFGMLIGAVILGLVGDRVSKTRVVIASFAGIGLLFMVGPVLINIWYLAIVALAAGLGFSWIGIAQTAILQTRVEAEIQGRVFATREFFSNAALVATTVLIGVLGLVAHLKLVLVLVGVGLLAVSAFGWWLVRGLDDRSPA